MTLDLTGRLPRAFDEATIEPPDTPDYREGASMWLWDSSGNVGVPRIAVEAVGATWISARFASANVSLADGSVLSVRDSCTASEVFDRDGRPRVFGAGPVRFECVEPFKQWLVECDGTATRTTVRNQIAVCTGEPVIDSSREAYLRIQITADMVAPPWEQGTLEPEGSFIANESRIEQLFSASGMIEIDGVSNEFRGGGLRIRRRGGSRSDYSDWHGHCWQSAFFPSGRAFGYIHYHPRDDGSVKYHEGWVLDGGKVLAAKAIETSWKSEYREHGEDVSLMLRTIQGDFHIQGTTRLPTFNPAVTTPSGATFPPTQQAICLYRWDREEAFGMLERSSKLQRTDLVDKGSAVL